MNETATPTAPQTAPQTVSPEELTALVARLHERNEAMTTADVAGALGMDEADVAAAANHIADFSRF